MTTGFFNPILHLKAGTFSMSFGLIEEVMGEMDKEEEEGEKEEEVEEEEAAEEEGEVKTYEKEFFFKKLIDKLIWD